MTLHRTCIVTAALYLSLTAILLGCGGSQASSNTPESPSEAEHSSEPSDVSGTDELENSSTTRGQDDVSGDSERVSEMGEMAPPVPEDWELPVALCDQLRTSYEALMLKDEMAKLENKTMKESQRKTAENNARNVSKQGAENWYQACREVVGTIQPRPSWECATKANTLEGFKNCLAGTQETGAAGKQR